MKKIKAIFFDAGNTLIEFDHHLLLNTFIKHDLLISLENLKIAECKARPFFDKQYVESKSPYTMSMHLHTVFSFLNHPYSKAKLELCFTEIDEINTNRNCWCSIIPNTQMVLTNIKKEGYYMGIISNADGRLKSLLKLIELDQYFDHIIDSAEVLVEKPDPRIFQMALRESGYKPEESVYIGDMYTIDIEGSRNVGMTPILLDPIGAWEHVSCLKAKNLEACHRIIKLLP